MEIYISPTMDIRICSSAVIYLINKFHNYLTRKKKPATQAVGQTRL